MLRSNLATRPFYNDRAVRVGLALAAVAAVALTVYNGLELVSLNGRNREVVARAEAAEGRAREVRAQAAATRQSLARDNVAEVQSAAREANLLIERRAFSWTELFNRFEETLPADVRIAAVQPQLDTEGRMLVAVTVVSRRIEDLDSFIDRLEQTGAFRSVLSRQEQHQDDGMLRSIIQGYYGPSAPARPAAGDTRTSSSALPPPSVAAAGDGAAR
ncbi:MAG: hypothetical protein ACT4QD_17770 [Acidobacteriota bacterium]